MTRNRIYLLSLILLGCAGNTLAQENQSRTIQSPDGHVACIFFIRDQQLRYQITYRHKPVIESSSLGIVTDAGSYTSALSLDSCVPGKIWEAYPWRGVHSTALNHCITARIHVKGKTAAWSFYMEVRVYDDGVAWRYMLPGSGPRTVTADQTEFVLPEGSTLWCQPSTGDYEGAYRSQQVGEVQSGEKIGPPMTISLPDNAGYAAITEGGLTDFAGMSLVAEGHRAFRATLADSVTTGGVVHTPWRIVEIGADLNSLVNCDIIHNVYPSYDKALFPQGFQTAWVQPGKAVWSWLAGTGRVTFENMKRYSAWASALDFPYNLVDSGWWFWKDGDKDRWQLLRELVRYSDSLHVKIWVWLNYQDRGTIPGMKHPDIRREVLEKCKEAGVAGVKIDYLLTEKPEVIRFYCDALEEAAKLHLMIDFHGAAKPVGITRAFPNEMSREAIRGLEYGSIPGKTTDWPVHNTILPFTRFLAGHADYTPLSFRSNIQGTTWAHQVASTVVFTSSFMCLAVNPEFLLRNPCREMVERLPVTWDETRVLPPSSIGSLAVFARRKGSVWFLAAMNGRGARDINIPLSFLTPGKYRISILKDEPEKSDTVLTEKMEGRLPRPLHIRMNAGGGFVARFEKR